MKYKKLLSLLLALALVLSLLPVLPAYASAYDLYVAGVQVTDENKDDILGNGEAAYDPSSKTLTICKDITTDAKVIYNYYISGLTINVANNVTLVSTGADAIDLYDITTVTGAGALTVRSYAGSGFYLHYAGSTFQGINIDVSGTEYGVKSTTALTVSGGCLHAAGSTGALISSTLNLDGVSILNPAGGSFTDGKVVDAGGNTALDATIGSMEYYKLYVAGKQVTTANASDILGGGEASYNAITNTLTIRKDITTDQRVIYNYDTPGLKIYVANDVTLRSTGVYAVDLYESTEITGPGKLTAISDAEDGIYLHYAPSYFTEANIDASGAKRGVYSTTDLTVEAGTLHAAGPSGALISASLTLYDVAIVTPAGGSFTDGKVVDSVGDPATDVLITGLRQYDLYIAGTRVTNLNAADVLGNGVFSYNADTETLTINGSYSCTGDDALIKNDGIAGLTIWVASDVTLQTKRVGICICEDTLLTGSGKLTLASSESWGIQWWEDVVLTVQSTTADVTGYKALASRGFMVNVNLAVYDGSFLSLHSTYGSVVDTGDCHTITIGPGLTILDPAGCTVKTEGGNSWFENTNGSKPSSVTIGPIGTATKYDLWIGDVQVTSANASDPLGDGAFSYDASTTTLTLKKDCTVTGIGEEVVESLIDGLTIYVANDVTLTGDYDELYLHGDTTITGPGKLTLIDTNDYYGIDAVGDTTLTILDATVDAKGYFGICGNTNVKLIINSSTVHAVGAYCGIGNFGQGIVLNDCDIRLPAGAQIVTGNITEADGTTLALDVTIEPVGYYDLWIAGMQVTSANASDPLGDGAFSYDASSKTLTLKKDCTVTGISEEVVESEIDGLIVYVANDVTLTGDYDEFYLKRNTAFTGPGKLTLVDTGGYWGIDVYDSYNVDPVLVIKDANIDATGDAGIAGNEGGERLVVINSTIHAVGTDPSDGAIAFFDGGFMLDGCAITLPVGAKTIDGTVFEADGTTPALEVMIAPVERYDLWICGTQVSDANASDPLGDGAFSYDASSKTLTLKKDCTISGVEVVESEIDGLTVCVANDVTITGDYDEFYLKKDTTFTGPGKLTLVDTGGYYGIDFFDKFDVDPTLTIKDANIDATGQGGITGCTNGEKLVVIHSTIHAVSTDPSYGAINYFTGGITLDGCEITAPAGAVIVNGGVMESDGTTPALEVTIEPVTAPTYFTVTFNANGHGTAPAAQTVESGKTATEPTAPTAEGWNFGGWYKEAACANKFDFSTPITADVTLYAKWTQVTYTVSFDANGHGAAPAAQTVAHGATATEPAAPTAEGWSFGGWYKEAACANKFDFSTPITADVTLYAKWTESIVPITYFTVTFNANGHGAAPAAQTVEKGKPAVEPAAPTEEGWAFGGWYLESECVNKYDFSTPVTADLELYAKWTEKPIYDVTFHSEHGTYSTWMEHVYEGETVAEPAAQTDPNWVFEAWYTDEAFTAKYDFSTPVTANLDLYAKWTEIIVPPTYYTVTFDANGHGASPEPQTVEAGATVEKPAYLVADGWVFGGWYTEPECTNAYDFSAPVTSSFTLYAKWTEDVIPVTYYTVFFDANGHGEAPIDQSIEEGTTATEPAAPTAEGWIFGGWYLEAECVNKYDFSTPVTANLTLYAKWTEKPAELVNPFTDVHTTDYFYDPVLWAYYHVPQVTTGTTPTTFSPDKTCTRAQVVTFLWRAKGCPEPTMTESPFSDVQDPSQYYYKAVLWAVENGITSGTSATTFSPGNGCTRAQVVTFLWRTEGKPAPAVTENPFSDVPAGEYYTDAVLWAVGKGVTTGTSADKFSPDKTCTRGQIVTFLYRDLS